MKLLMFRRSDVKTKITGHEYEYHNHVFFALNLNDAIDKAKIIYEEHIDDFRIFTLTELKAFCASYDKRWGTHPESEYEGAAILEHIIEECKL